MKVHYGTDAIPTIKNPVVTSGTFDGVHIGHRTILSRLKEIAQAVQGETVVITFWPHPRFVLSNYSEELKILSTIDEKIQLLSEQQIDYLIIIPFTLEFSNLSSQEFIQTILIDKIKTYRLVIGYDHRFGKNREGSFEYLKEHQSKLGFQVEEIPRKDLEHVGISSTKIREYLLSGKVFQASTYLGQPYFLNGKVIIGQQNGRKIGFPTANIEVSENYKLIPSDGVYAVKVFLKDHWYYGMLNIGFRPTLDGAHKSIEVNIFDFHDDIYGAPITIHFLKLIREEVKFGSLADLKAQLIKDKEKTKAIIEQYEKL